MTDLARDLSNHIATPDRLGALQILDLDPRRGAGFVHTVPPLRDDAFRMRSGMEERRNEFDPTLSSPWESESGGLNHLQFA